MKIETIPYTVVITHKGDTARLTCATLAEAQNLKQAYLNWGGYEQVTIEQEANQ